MHTICGGSAASSRYIVYSEVPGAVFRTHGSSFVPLPLAIALSLADRMDDQSAGRRRRASHPYGKPIGERPAIALAGTRANRLGGRLATGRATGPQGVD